jgi:hypothetical protein
MNEYATYTARRLLSNSKSFRDLTVAEAYIFLDEDHDVGVWAGSPEGEMARAYISDKTLVCRFILSLATPGWMDGGDGADATAADLCLPLP